jgi:hypothetical protein
VPGAIQAQKSAMPKINKLTERTSPEQISLFGNPPCKKSIMAANWLWLNQTLRGLLRANSFMNYNQWE